MKEYTSRAPVFPVGMEHWVVMQGTAKVVSGNEEMILTKHQSTYIPLGTAHRLENPGKIPLHGIEVQSGSYLGEDGIVRVEVITASDHALVRGRCARFPCLSEKDQGIFKKYGCPEPPMTRKLSLYQRLKGKFGNYQVNVPNPSGYSKSA
jgi:hypothetical protein